MKKVVIFTMHTGFGGIERYVATLANMLSEDYSVKIIATYGSKEKQAFSYNKHVKVKHLVSELPETISIKKLFESRDFLGIIKEIPRRMKLNCLKRFLTIREIKRMNADIVITERAYYSRLVGKYCKDPRVKKIASDHNFHNGNREYINELVKSVKRFDYLVVATDELYRSYKDIIGKVKCVLIPNALPKISKMKTDFSCRNLMAVGRFEPEKGFLDLIDVMQLVHGSDKKVRLFLIGDGSQRSEIERRIRGHKLERVIKVTGFLTQKEIERYYLKSSLYVLTSYTEAFGLVLIEAMNYGLPCVAFSCASGARELLAEGIGVLVSRRNKRRMADEIVTLLQDKKLLKAMQKKIDIEIEKYGPSVIKEAWTKILE